MISIRSIILVVCMLNIFACSSLPGFDEVVPDKRKTYLKSQNLPPLEVPPDLTVTKGQYSADIPGDKEANTLSEFERQRAAGKRKPIGGAVLGGGETEGEQWLALQGNTDEVWPQLVRFWQDKEGYLLDINDAELGVLETQWKENKGLRYRFKVFAEPSQTGDTVIFLSSERQEALEGSWLEAGSDVELEKKVIRKLSLDFYGTEISNSTTPTTSSATAKVKTVKQEQATLTESEKGKATAKVKTVKQGQATLTKSEKRKATAKVKTVKQGQATLTKSENGKIYLHIPSELTQAWNDVELILDRAGYSIPKKEPEIGTYHFLYRYRNSDEDGSFSKLKFWDDGIVSHQLRLTHTKNGSKVVVKNGHGSRLSNEQARIILVELKELYNQL